MGVNITSNIEPHAVSEDSHSNLPSSLPDSPKSQLVEVLDDINTPNPLESHYSNSLIFPNKKPFFSNFLQVSNSAIQLYELDDECSESDNEKSWFQLATLETSKNPPSPEKNSSNLSLVKQNIGFPTINPSVEDTWIQKLFSNNQRSATAVARNSFNNPAFNLSNFIPRSIKNPSDWWFWPLEEKKHKLILPHLLSFLTEKQKQKISKEAHLLITYKSLNSNWINAVSSYEAKNNYFSDVALNKNSPELQRRKSSASKSSPNVLSSLSSSNTPMSFSKPNSKQEKVAYSKALRLADLWESELEPVRYSSKQKAGWNAKGPDRFTSDVVRSDAELQEIIQRLQYDEIRNPDSRSQKTAAVIPDMVLDSSEFEIIKLKTSSRIISNPIKYFSVSTETHVPHDSLHSWANGSAIEFFGNVFNNNCDQDHIWSREESQKFVREYLRNPKKFGKIAEALPYKTPRDCVLFYYRNKYALDLKSLLNRYKRKSRRARKNNSNTISSDILRRSDRLVERILESDSRGGPKQQNTVATTTTRSRSRSTRPPLPPSEKLVGLGLPKEALSSNEPASNPSAQKLDPNTTEDILLKSSSLHGISNPESSQNTSATNEVSSNHSLTSKRSRSIHSRKSSYNTDVSNSSLATENNRENPRNESYSNLRSLASKSTASNETLSTSSIPETRNRTKSKPSKSSVALDNQNFSGLYQTDFDSKNASTTSTSNRRLPSKSTHTYSDSDRESGEISDIDTENEETSSKLESNTTLSNFPKHNNQSSPLSFDQSLPLASKFSPSISYNTDESLDIFSTEPPSQRRSLGNYSSVNDSFNLELKGGIDENQFDRFVFFGPTLPPDLSSSIQPTIKITDAIPQGELVLFFRGLPNISPKSRPSQQTCIFPETDAGEKSDMKLGAVIWNYSERVKVLNGFLRFGRNFADICRLVKSKSEAQCRYFYYHYRLANGSMLSEIVEGHNTTSTAGGFEQSSRKSSTVSNKPRQPIDTDLVLPTPVVANKKSTKKVSQTADLLKTSTFVFSKDEFIEKPVSVSDSLSVQMEPGDTSSAKIKDLAPTEKLAKSKKRQLDNKEKGLSKPRKTSGSKKIKNESNSAVPLPNKISTESGNTSSVVSQILALPKPISINDLHLPPAIPSSSPQQLGSITGSTDKAPLRKEVPSKLSLSHPDSSKEIATVLEPVPSSVAPSYIPNSSPTSLYVSIARAPLVKDSVSKILPTPTNTDSPLQGIELSTPSKVPVFSETMVFKSSIDSNSEYPVQFNSSQLPLAQPPVLADNKGFHTFKASKVQDTPSRPNAEKEKGPTSAEKSNKKLSYSSYWSVQERNNFVSLLSALGTNWGEISNALGTKTTTQVRNFYKSQKEKLGLEDVVKEYEKNIAMGVVPEIPILINTKASKGSDSIPEKRGRKKKSLDSRAEMPVITELNEKIHVQAGPNPEKRILAGDPEYPQLGESMTPVFSNVSNLSRPGSSISSKAPSLVVSGGHAFVYNPNIHDGSKVNEGDQKSVHLSSMASPDNTQALHGSVAVNTGRIDQGDPYYDPQSKLTFEPGHPVPYKSQPSALDQVAQLAVSRLSPNNDDQSMISTSRVSLPYRTRHTNIDPSHQYPPENTYTHIKKGDLNIPNSPQMANSQFINEQEHQFPYSRNSHHETYQGYGPRPHSPSSHFNPLYSDSVSSQPTPPPLENLPVYLDSPKNEPFPEHQLYKAEASIKPSGVNIKSLLNQSDSNLLNVPSARDAYFDVKSPNSIPKEVSLNQSIHEPKHARAASFSFKEVDHNTFYPSSSLHRKPSKEANYINSLSPNAPRISEFEISDASSSAKNYKNKPPSIPQSHSNRNFVKLDSLLEAASWEAQRNEIQNKKTPSMHLSHSNIHPHEYDDLSIKSAQDSSYHKYYSSSQKFYDHSSYVRNTSSQNPEYYHQNELENRENRGPKPYYYPDPSYARFQNEYGSGSTVRIPREHKDPTPKYPNMHPEQAAQRYETGKASLHPHPESLRVVNKLPSTQQYKSSEEFSDVLDSESLQSAKKGQRLVKSTGKENTHLLDEYENRKDPKGHRGDTFRNTAEAGPSSPASFKVKNPPLGRFERANPGYVQNNESVSRGFYDSIDPSRISSPPFDRSKQIRLSNSARSSIRETRDKISIDGEAKNFDNYTPSSVYSDSQSESASKGTPGLYNSEGKHHGRYRDHEDVYSPGGAYSSLTPYPKTQPPGYRYDDDFYPPRPKNYEHPSQVRSRPHPQDGGYPPSNYGVYGNYRMPNPTQRPANPALSMGASGPNSYPQYSPQSLSGNVNQPPGVGYNNSVRYGQPPYYGPSEEYYRGPMNPGAPGTPGGHYPYGYAPPDRQGNFGGGNEHAPGQNTPDMGYYGGQPSSGARGAYYRPPNVPENMQGSELSSRKSSLNGSVNTTQGPVYPGVSAMQPSIELSKSMGHPIQPSTGHVMPGNFADGPKQIMPLRSPHPNLTSRMGVSGGLQGVEDMQGMKVNQNELAKNPTQVLQASSRVKGRLPAAKKKKAKTKAK
ncbi:hypothetical protein BB560_001865 [Smittium megazygosporum]|uniref:SANT domain-containing protein n=1 Tax=Smittium megazygosporum TaxID=133381 RepID=A0A2T9ZGB2_9FUNG|nr:hypothetical protein BB560_001865 [Smittium megazygosporum]